MIKIIAFNTSQLLDIRKLCIPKDGPPNNKIYKTENYMVA